MSFFDDPTFMSPSGFEICKTCRQQSDINMEKKVLYEGELTLKPAPGIIITKYFKLLDRKLVYFSPKNPKIPKGYYDLMTFLKIINIDTYDLISKKPIPAFRLEKFGKYHEFSHKDPNQIKAWVRILRLYCVSNDFESRYERSSMLGKGHFAKVFKVKSVDNGIFFAAKIMTKDQKFESQKQYVYNEVRILKSLPKNQHIIKLYEVYDSVLELVLIFEYIEGGDLYQLIKKSKTQPIPLEVLAAIFSQIIRGLMFLHSRFIMHRDIKPENILLTDTTEFKEVKIADFSLAEEFQNKSINVKCGTPGYMAPEIFQNKGYDERVDVYSLGVILFMMLTKKSPFKGKDAKEILNKNKQNVILYKKADWLNIDDSIRRMVYDLTMKDPNERLTLHKVVSHVWLKPFFKDIIEEVKTNGANKPKKLRSEVENQFPARLDSELDSSKNNGGTLKVLSCGSSHHFLNFNLNSVNSLFIGTNGTSENSYALLSPGMKSFNSIMDSPKEKKAQKKNSEDTNNNNDKSPEKPKSFFSNEVLTETERTLRFCVFADENPVGGLIQHLNNMNKKPRPSKSFRF